MLHVGVLLCFVTSVEWFVERLGQVWSVDSIRSVGHNRKFDSIHVSSEAIRDSIFILNRLVNVNVMFVNKAQQLGTTSMQQTRLTIIICDRILRNNGLGHLLDLGDRVGVLCFGAIDA